MRPVMWTERAAWLDAQAAVRASGGRARPWRPQKRYPSYESGMSGSARM